jgi:hypothetical protein
MRRIERMLGQLPPATANCKHQQLPFNHCTLGVGRVESLAPHPKHEVGALRN